MKSGLVFAIRVLFALYIAAVCCLSFLNLSFPLEMKLPTYVWDIRIDRIVHFLMFLPYPIIAIPVFNLSKKNSGLKIVRSILIFLTGIAFAAITELIQYYILEFREGDIIDFKADLLGLMAGLVLFFIIYPPIMKRMISSDSI